MGKDLRTTAVSMKLHRYPPLNGTLWGLQNAQPFFPPLETLFKTERLSAMSEYGVRLAEEIETVVDPTHIRTTRGNVVPVHRKTTMILSPFKWMRGDYGAFGLPKPDSIATDMQTMLQSHHTAGYVGAMTAIALSESGCIHFPKVYGVYVGLAENHTIDISDDYEDLVERHWFSANLGKTFELKVKSPDPSAEFSHTRGHRTSVLLGDEATLEGIEDVHADHVSVPSSRSHEVESEPEEETSLFEDESDDDSDDAFEIVSCDCESEDESDEDEADEEEPFAWATFHNVPVITTVMEACEGTFYDLIAKDSDPTHHTAWVAQLVFALAFAQRNYGFVHNDLHGNNVMYVPTSQEYIYYKYNGAVYRLPTFGVCIKLIDFDRAILSLRLVGMKDPRRFVSSQFQADDEAAGQYNIEPFLNNDHPIIPASPSFDLCRFATSVFWDMFPDGPDAPSTHPLFEVFKQWMTQSDGSSVMFRSKRDNHDRYHGFHLYKAIARYCRDSATPRRELAKLAAFRIPTLPLGAPCLAIDS